MMSCERRLTKRMKQKFLAGASTSAHQTEGNNIYSDSWAMENFPHSIYKEVSGSAMDHYNRYREDLDLLKNAGLNAYRFSIEWARVEPEKGKINEREIQHYSDVIDACYEREITPIVTLHHFTSPVWVIRNGGWKNEAIISEFADYCREIVKRLGNKIPYIVTINEANMGLQLHKIAQQYMAVQKTETASSDQPQIGLNLEEQQKTMMSYLEENRDFFGREDINCFLDSRTKEQEILVMRTHQAARAAIKEIYPEIKVGASFSLFDIQALPGGEQEADQLWNDDFEIYLPYVLDDDFIGVQNYTRKVIGTDGVVPQTDKSKLTDAGYEFYPEAIEHVVRRVASEWEKEILVTENGVSTEDDTKRVEFVKKAIDGIAACVRDGINVTAYCHWSLLDNFEWQLGYAQKFGLIAVDRDTMIRTVKPSLAVFGQAANKYLL